MGGWAGIASAPGCKAVRPMFFSLDGKGESMSSASIERQRDDAAVVSPAGPVAAVRAVLAVDDVKLDYARAKLAFDRIVDPSLAPAETLRELDRLTAVARGLAGAAASPDARMAALRHGLHVAGAWNDYRPFAYDQADPLGQRIAGKLLATCLATRRGNCVSLPALFMILAGRLGLDVAFATAPLHVFVRYASEGGRVVNIEAANGGHPTRDAWYRERMPMRDGAVARGLYLRPLTKREGVALQPTTDLEHKIERRR